MKTINFKKFKAPNSLKGKIFVCIFICMLIFATFSLNFLSIQNTVAQQEVFKKFHISLNDLNEKIVSAVNNSYNLIETLSSDYRIVNLLNDHANNKPLNEIQINSNKLQRDMDKLVSKFKSFNFLILTNAEGDVLTTNSQNAQKAKFQTNLLKSHNFKQHDFFKKIYEKKKIKRDGSTTSKTLTTIIEGPVHIPILAELSNDIKTFIVIATPIINEKNKQIMGVLIGFIPFKFINDIIKKHSNDFTREKNWSATFALFDDKEHQIGGFKFVRDKKPIDRFIKLYPELKNTIFNKPTGNISFFDPLTRLDTKVNFTRLSRYKNFDQLKWVSVLCAYDYKSLPILNNIDTTFFLTIIVSLFLVVAGFFSIHLWGIIPLYKTLNLTKEYLEGNRKIHLQHNFKDYESIVIYQLMQKYKQLVYSQEKMKEYNKNLSQLYNYEKEHFVSSKIHDLEKKFRMPIHDIFSTLVNLESKVQKAINLIAGNLSELKKEKSLTTKMGSLDLLKNQSDLIHECLPLLQDKMSKISSQISKGISDGEKGFLLEKVILNNLTKLQNSINTVDSLQDKFNLMVLNAHIEQSKNPNINPAKLIQTFEGFHSIIAKTNENILNNFHEVIKSFNEYRQVSKKCYTISFDIAPICTTTRKQINALYGHFIEYKSTTEKLCNSISEKTFFIKRALDQFTNIHYFGADTLSDVKKLVEISSDLERDLSNLSDNINQEEAA